MENGDKIIAIIGTSIGQSGLFKSASKLGLKTIAFSVPGNKDYSYLADKHYHISVDDVDSIVQVCKENRVCGVVSNGSDFTAKYANEIAFRLGLPSNDPLDLLKASDKNYVREQTKNIDGLAQIKHSIYYQDFSPQYPCIIKPISSGGKNGLSIARDSNSFDKAIEYAKQCFSGDILVEEFIDGLELSVEVLSANGKHYVIQTCEAETSGEPHFVEIAHHLPANISRETDMKIRKIVPCILDAINFRNGATDIEMKVDSQGNVYLIEVNLRGAGGNITNHLISLSTGYDYLGGLIEISIGEFKHPEIRMNEFVGDYYLCAQTLPLMPLFAGTKPRPWLIESTIRPEHLNNIKEVKTNGDRDGYIIYKSAHRVTLKDA